MTDDTQRYVNAILQNRYNPKRRWPTGNGYLLLWCIGAAVAIWFVAMTLFVQSAKAYPLDCGTDKGTDWYEECTSGLELDLTVLR